MRNLKRMISVLLVLVMCVSMAPFAFAEAPYPGDHTGSVTVTVRDAVTASPIAGASVQLEDITAGREHNHGTKITTADGTATWEGLSSGWYRVIQTKTTEDYILNSEEIVRFLDTDQNKTMSVTITNRAKNAIYIYRIDATTGKGIEGARYLVTDSAGHEVGQGSTNEEGFLIIPGLGGGEYTVTELSTPDGYKVASPNVQKVHLTETEDVPAMVVFTSAEKSAITIYNYDGVTMEPIEGSVWIVELVGGGYSSGRVTTSAAGVVVVDGLDPGTYRITEVQVPGNYTPDMKSATVTLGQEKENRTVSFSNTKCTGTVTVHVQGYVDSGCDFYLYDANGKVVQGPVKANQQGIVTFRDVPDGTYTVSGVASDDSVLQPPSVNVEVKAGSSESASFTATEKGSILIKAQDKNNPQKLIPNCSFEVRAMDGTSLGTYTTGADGTVRIKGLDNGAYVITETAAATGYVMETGTKSVNVTAGEETTVVFLHRDRPYITAYVFVTGTATPIPGATVTLITDTGKTVGTGITAPDGSYVFEDLNPGMYTVELTAVPDGYVIDTASSSVSVTSETSGTANLYAKRNSTIVVTKLDAATHKPLAGAAFLIRNSVGEIVDTIATDISGTAVSQPLEPGQYSVQEQTAPAGYMPDTSARAATVHNNQTTTLTFTNEQKTGIVVYAYDGNGFPVVGVSFVLHEIISGREIATKMTDTAGVATFEDLAPGPYMVSELIVPDGYVVMTPTQARVDVQAGLTSFVRFPHVAQAVIQIQTVDIDTGASITGAVYHVMNADGSFDANYDVDQNGEVVVGPLPLGTYYVKQIEAPDGYQLNTTTQTITIQTDRVNLAKFFNKKTSAITIEAVVTGQNFGIGGVTFTVEDEDGKEVARGTTTEEGIYYVPYLDPGHYTVKAISYPDGLTCIQRQRTLEVTYNVPTSVKFEFTTNCRIVVNLKDAADPSKGLAGATFRVESTTGHFVTDIVTNSAGVAMTEAIPNGEYVVYETVAPVGYILDQSYQWATVDESGNTVLDFTNRVISALVIQSLVEDTHAPIAGVTYEVWEQNGKLVQTLTSDRTGVVTVPTLAPGVYLIKMVACPDGYAVRTATQTVTISTDRPTTVDFYYVEQGQVTINVYSAADRTVVRGVKVRVSDYHGVFVGEYTTDFHGQIIIPYLPAGTYNLAIFDVPGSFLFDPQPQTFVVRDDQNTVVDLFLENNAGVRLIDTCEETGLPIEDSVFRVTTYNGTLVGTYTTDANGVINFDLAPGIYTIVQLSVPEGFVLNENVWNITVHENESHVVDVRNHILSGIKITFIDADTREPVPDVKIELKTSKNNLISSYQANSEGQIVLREVFGDRNFRISITDVPSNYIKDEQYRDFEVKPGETTEIIWELHSRRGQITIVTMAGEDNVMMNIRKNTILAGAVYQITDSTGKIVANIIGDVNGCAYTGALQQGTYFCQMITAPFGWQLNTTRFTVRLSNSNDNVRVEVYIPAANYKTTVTANGPGVAYANSVVKYYFTLQNASTCAMSNFYLHIKVPTDCARAVTFYTGTFTGPATTFYVQVKTNMRDYYTIAENLNSHSNYSFGVSTQALGLQDGEFVTDIRMVFDTAVAGFSHSMAPVLNVYILSTVKTGYEVVMRAECGGLNTYYLNSSTGTQWGSTTGGDLYNNTPSDGWTTGSGECRTFLYGYPQNPVPPSLPTTGY